MSEQYQEYLNLYQAPKEGRMAEGDVAADSLAPATCWCQSRAVHAGVLLAVVILTIYCLRKKN